MARHHGLDAARALAMLLVVVTHAAISFMVTPVGWAVQDSSHHLAVDLYVWVVRAFAMPLFFWLAGYFSRAAHAAGPRAFARNRLLRIALPFAIALVPCSLAIGALWDWGREVAARAAIPANAPAFKSSELPLMLAHLWFLYYLMLLSAAAVALATLARRLRVTMPVAATLAVPALLVIGALVYLGALHTDTPLSFVPDVPIAIYMGGFFAWGWLVHAHPGELERYARRAWHALAIAPALLAVVALALHDSIAAPTPSAPPLHACVASGLFSLAVVAGMLGLCVRYARTPRPLVRLGAASSYWMYVVHLPIVVVLQIAAAATELPGPLEYVAIVVVTLLVGLATYQLGPQVKLQVQRIVRPARHALDAE